MIPTREHRDRDQAQLRARWYAEGHHGARTLPDTLELAARRFADTRFVFTSDAHRTEFSLAEMVEQGRRLAVGLRTLGIRPGDVVAVQVPNRPELVAAYFGTWLAGAVLVPVTHIYGPAELGHIVRDAGARVLVVPDAWRSIDFLERVARLGDTPTLEHVVVIGPGRADGTLRWSDLLDARVGSGSYGTAPTGRGADEVCAVIYTSGTTGSPKGVQHTHNTLLAELRKGDLMSGPGPDGGRHTRLIPWPSGHIAGLLSLCDGLTGGTHTVVMDRWRPEPAVELIEHYGCTLTSGTPLHVEAILAAAASTGRDVSSLRSVQVGGANVPPSLVERADAAGIVVARAYGSTEHPRSATAPLDAPAAARSGSDGMVRFGDEIAIVDEAGTALPAGRVGEIVTRGPSRFAGYRDPEHDAAAFLPGGWFRTGDVGRLDEAGWLTVTDRIKDLIIRGGENIASKEVEDVLATDPRVVHAAVVAAPHPRLGETVAAFVVLDGGATLELAEVRALFAERGVAPQKAPEHLFVVDELPRAPSGKVRKFELRDAVRVELGVPLAVATD